MVYALSIVIPLTVQGLLSLTYLLVEMVHHVHSPSEPSDLGNERLVPNTLQRVIDFMVAGVFAAEVLQLNVPPPPLYMHPSTVGLTPIRTWTYLAGATPRPLVVGIRKGR
jgi:hypothetical protein